MSGCDLGDIPPSDYVGRLQALSDWVLWDPGWINTQITAVKAHALLYGLFPGLTLGMLAVIGPPLRLPTGNWSPVAWSLVVALLFLLVAGFRFAPASVVTRFCTDRSIALLEIAFKPHYFAGGLAIGWGLAAGAAHSVVVFAVVVI